MTTKTTTLYKNNGRTTLAANISAIATTIPVADATLLPAPTTGQEAQVTLDDGTYIEIVRYTGVTGNNLIGCTRGYEGTSPRAFTALVTRVENRLTAGNIAKFARLQDRVAYVDWITGLSDASASDSNTYLTTTAKTPSDDPYFVYKNGSTWSVLGYDVLVLPETQVGSGATTTSIPLPASQGKLGAVKATEYLLIFTAGSHVGKIRKIASINTSINWSASDVLPSAPLATDTYKIVAFNNAAFETANSLSTISRPQDMKATSLITSTTGRDGGRVLLLAVNDTRWISPQYPAQVRSGTVTGSSPNMIAWNYEAGTDPALTFNTAGAYLVQVKAADGSWIQLGLSSSFTSNSITIGTNWSITPPVGSTFQIFVSNVDLGASAGSFLKISSSYEGTPQMDGVGWAGDSSLWSHGNHRHPTDTSRAPLDSPALTGAPTTTNPPPNDLSYRIANTAWYHGQAYGAVPPSSAIFPAGSIGDSSYWARGNHAHPVDTTRAPTNNPTFTGTATFQGSALVPSKPVTTSYSDHAVNVSMLQSFWTSTFANTFYQSLGSTAGYIHIGNFIIQWTHAQISGSSYTLVYWPIAFPAICAGAVVSPNNSPFVGNPPQVSGFTTSTFHLDSASASDTPKCFIIGIGW